MAVIKVTDSDFDKVVQENSKIVVKFYADWCGSCRLLAPKYKRLSEEEGMNDIAFLDINAEENPEVRKKVGVSNLPFIATYSNGELQKADAIAKIEGIREMVELL